MSNLDFAQTFLDIAGVSEIPDPMQGASLVPIFKGITPKDWRKSFYYHYYEFPGAHSVRRHYGVRKDNYKLIHFYNLNAWELFDLQKDPNELNSVYSEADYQGVVKDLKIELNDLRTKYKVPEDTRPVTRGNRKNKNRKLVKRISEVTRSHHPLSLYQRSPCKESQESRFNPTPKGCYLGIVIEETKQGIWVKEVVPGGAAEISGIQTDDIIVRYGSWRFNLNEDSFQKHLRESDNSKTIIQVLRDGSELDIQIKPDPILVRDAKEIARLIKRNRLFRDQLNVEQSKLETDLVKAVRASSSNEQAYRKLNQIVDRFNLSHTAVITPWVAKNIFGEGDKFHLGLYLQKIKHEGKNKYFIRSMMHGSAAREVVY